MEATTRAKFKVKIRSLAEEARIIRSMCRKHRGEWQYVAGNLRSHAVTVVRQEQRITLLAYAFCRGVEYRVVERDAGEMNKYKTIELSTAVSKCCNRFRGFNSAIHGFTSVNPETIRMWMSKPRDSSSTHNPSQLGVALRGQQPAFNPAETGSTPVTPLNQPVSPVPDPVE